MIFPYLIKRNPLFFSSFPFFLLYFGSFFSLHIFLIPYYVKIVFLIDKFF